MPYKCLRLILFLGVLGIPAFAQCTAGSMSTSSTQANCVQQLFYNSTPSLTYVCAANALQPVSTFYRSSSTLTSIVVATNVGTINFSSTSYLWVGATVVVAGSTTSALNGTYQVSAVSGSTATIATSGVADATYNNAAMTVSTTSPLLNASVWAIQVLKYNATPSLTSVFWAGLPSTSVPHALKCSDRGNY